MKWELGILGELGFALDFSQCAATGSLDDLAYVSPKSGRSVSTLAAEPYRERMLELPKFLLDSKTRIFKPCEYLSHDNRMTRFLPFVARYLLFGMYHLETPYIVSKTAMNIIPGRFSTTF